MTSKRRLVFLSWGASFTLAAVLAFSANRVSNAYYPIILALSLGLGIYAELLRRREQRAEDQRLDAAYRALQSKGLR